MNLEIQEQTYPTATGETPLSFAVYLYTEDDLPWLDCPKGFLCYSWTKEGAERAIAELERFHEFQTTII